MPENKLQSLYDAVSQDYDLGTFNDFENSMNDPSKRKSFYDAVSKKYDLGTFDSFESNIGVKKKSGPESGTPYKGFESVGSQLPAPSPKRPSTSALRPFDPKAIEQAIKRQGTGLEAPADMGLTPQQKQNEAAVKAQMQQDKDRKRRTVGVSNEALERFNKTYNTDYKDYNEYLDPEAYRSRKISDLTNLISDYVDKSGDKFVLPEGTLKPDELGPKQQGEGFMDRLAYSLASAPSAGLSSPTYAQIIRSFPKGLNDYIDKVGKEQGYDPEMIEAAKFNIIQMYSAKGVSTKQEFEKRIQEGQVELKEELGGKLTPSELNKDNLQIRIDNTVDKYNKQIASAATTISAQQRVDMKSINDQFVRSLDEYNQKYDGFQEAIPQLQDQLAQDISDIRLQIDQGSISPEEGEAIITQEVSQLQGQIDQFTNDTFAIQQQYEEYNKQVKSSQSKYLRSFKAKQQALINSAKSEIDSMLHGEYYTPEEKEKIRSFYERNYKSAFAVVNARDIQTEADKNLFIQMGDYWQKGTNNMTSSLAGAMSLFGAEEMGARLRNSAAFQEALLNVPDITLTGLEGAENVPASTRVIAATVPSLPMMVTTLIPAIGATGTAASFSAKMGASRLAAQLIGSTAGALASHFAENLILESGEAYSSAIREGKSAQEANAQAWKRFAYNTPSLLFGAIQMAPFVTKMSPIKSLATETLSEGVQEVTQGYAERMSQGYDGSFIQYAFGDPQAKEEFYSALLMGSVPGALAMSGTGFSNIIRDRYYDKKVNDFITKHNPSMAPAILEMLNKNSIIPDDVYNDHIQRIMKQVDINSKIPDVVNDAQRSQLVDAYTQIDDISSQIDQAKQENAFPEIVVGLERKLEDQKRRIDDVMQDKGTGYLVYTDNKTPMFFDENTFNSLKEFPEIASKINSGSYNVVAIGKTPAIEKTEKSIYPKDREYQIAELKDIITRLGEETQDQNFNGVFSEGNPLARISESVATANENVINSEEPSLEDLSTVEKWGWLSINMLNSNPNIPSLEKYESLNKIRDVLDEVYLKSSKQQGGEAVSPTELISQTIDQEISDAKTQTQEIPSYLQDSGFTSEAHILNAFKKYMGRDVKSMGEISPRELSALTSVRRSNKVLNANQQQFYKASTSDNIPLGTTTKQKSISKSVSQLLHAFSNMDLGVVMVDNASEFAKIQSDITGIYTPVGKASNGFYDPRTNVVYINMDSPKKNVGFHEFMHPMLNYIKVQNPKLYANMIKEASVITSLPKSGAEGYISYLDWAKQNYAGQPYDVIANEALTELISDYTSGKISANKSLSDRIREFIQKVLSFFGIKVSSDQFIRLDLSNDSSVRTIATQIAEAINKGKTIENVSPPLNARVTDTDLEFSKEYSGDADIQGSDFFTHKLKILFDPDKYGYSEEYQHLEDGLSAEYIMEYMQTEGLLEMPSEINQEWKNIKEAISNGADYFYEQDGKIVPHYPANPQQILDSPVQFSVLDIFTDDTRELTFINKRTSGVLRKQLKENPKAYYNKQTLSEIEGRINSMSEEELVDKMNESGLIRMADQISSENNIGIAAAGRLLNMYWEQKRTDEFQALMFTTANALKSYGQLIRQAGMIKGFRPEVLVEHTKQTLRKLNSQGRFLTEDQEKKLLLKSSEITHLGAKRKNAEEAFKKSMNPEDGDKYKKAIEEHEKAMADYGRYVERLTPKSFWDLLGTFIQGNLLAPISQVANVTSAIITTTEGAVTSPISSAIGYMRQKAMQWTGGSLTTTGYMPDPLGYITSFKSAHIAGHKFLDTLLNGNITTDPDMKEFRGGLKPFTALKEVFQKEAEDGYSVKRKVVKKNGKDVVEEEIILSDRLIKLMEGTLGIAPETMLRLLSLEKFATEYNLTRIRNGVAKAMKLEGDAYTNAVKGLNEDIEKIAKEEASRYTFQNNSTARKWAARMGNIGKGTPINTFVKLIIPYTSTPASILDYTMDYALPPYSLIKAFRYYGRAKQASTSGNTSEQFDYTRRGDLMFGKAIAGALMIYALRPLITNGLITEDPEDDRKKRAASYEVAPALSLNISGLSRYLNGGEAKGVPGDEYVKLTRLGIMGAILAIHSEAYYDDQTQGKRRPVNIKKPEDHPVLAPLSAFGDFIALGRIVDFAAQYSFLQGAQNIFAVLYNNSESVQQRFMAQMVSAASAVTLPNTLTYVKKYNTMYMEDYSYEKRNYNMLQRISKELYATMDKKGLGPLAQWLTDDAQNVYRVDPFGRDVVTLPEGENRAYAAFLDPFGTDIQTDDPIWNKVYDVFKETGDSDALPMPVDRDFSIQGESYSLYDRNEFNQYQRLLGQKRYEYAKTVLDIPGFDQLEPGIKVKLLDRAYDAANKSQEVLDFLIPIKQREYEKVQQGKE